KGQTGLMQSFISHKYRVSEDLTINGGLHHSYFVLNGSNSLEPRLGVKYNLKKNQSISAGFGVHSKMEDLTTYFSEIKDAHGERYFPNRDLEFTKAFHYVIGYDINPGKNMHIRTELYYQELKN